MVKVLIHELPDRSAKLLGRLREVLLSYGGGDAARLAERARIDDHVTPRMVLTGQYSSGKSSLIKALTDGAVDPEIGADIVTDSVTAYDWDGAVTLVDTPGVQSGLREHDEMAATAVGDADLVLFVITSNLTDDASSAYLRLLANDMQRADQMIVVITQARKQPAREGARAEHVREVLGTDSIPLPIAEVDSIYYLRSLEGGARADELRRSSGVDELREQLNLLSDRRGAIAKLRQPLHLARHLVDESRLLFVEDERSRAALGLIHAQRAAVERRRHAMVQSVSTAESVFKSHCLVEISGFVDTASSLPTDDAQADAIMATAKQRLGESLDAHAARFGETLDSVARAQFATLAEELGEIDAGNRARLVYSQSAWEQDDTAESDIGAPFAGHQTSGKRSGVGVNWQNVAEKLKSAQNYWGAGGGLRDSSGTFGHEAVKNIGHLFGHKFRPWEAIKIADKIGKLAKGAGFLVQVGTAAYSVIKQERDEMREFREAERVHSAFVTELMSHASRISDFARRKFWEAVEEPMSAYLDALQEAEGVILRADAARSRALEELNRISSEAEQLLRESVTPLTLSSGIEG